MKKYLTIFMIFGLLFLTSCGDKKGDSTPENYIESTPTSATDGDSKSDSDYSSEEKTGQCFWVIYNEDGIRIELMAVLNYDDGLPYYPVRVYVDEEKDYNITINNVKLNDKIWGDKISIYYLPVLGEDEVGVYKYGISNEWTNSILSAGEDKLRSLSATVEIYEKDLVLVKESDISFTLPEDYKTELVTEKFFGARAEKQILYEDDLFSVELLTMGYLPIDSSGGSSMRCAIKIDNNSNESFKFTIGGALINGIFIDSFSCDKTIAGKKYSYLDFRISDYDLEKVEIDKISDISLLLEVNKGFDSSLSKEKVLEVWCPIELAEKEDEIQDFNKGEPVFERDGVYVGLIDTSEIIDYGKSFYYWDMAIINDSDVGIKIKLNNESINGELVDEDELSSLSLYCDVGPHSKRYAKMAYMGEENENRPKVKCKFMITNMDDDKLIFLTDEEYEFK